MGDDSPDRPLRRRVLETVASVSVAGGLAGCLGILGDDGEGARSPSSTATENPPTSTATPENSPTSTATPENSPTPHPDDVPDHLVGEGPTVGLETVATGLGIPTGLDVVDGADGKRMFVAARHGTVHSFRVGGENSPVEARDRTPLLDLEDRVVSDGERGLLGVAVHPDFAENGRVFVRYSSPPRDDLSPSTPEGYEYDDHVEVLSEFQASEDGTTASRDSERVLLAIPQPARRHNSGDVLFGPDGYLYLTMGDGGHTTTGGLREWRRGGGSQNTRNDLLGGVLRISIDDDGENRPYAIPPDNPLVDRSGHRDEYYAWGFRNPWGTSFDGDDLYVAVVGRQLFEWVHLVEKGGNYGWPIKIGTQCNDIEDPTTPLETCSDRTPDAVRDGEPFIDPVVEYPREHEDTHLDAFPAVIGGGVYRGDASVGIRGEYVFGNLNGHLFVAAPPDDGEVLHPYNRERDLWPIRRLELANTEVVENGTEGIVNITAIGTGPDGEIYPCTTNPWMFENKDEYLGEVYRIDSPAGTE